MVLFEKIILLFLVDIKIISSSYVFVYERDNRFDDRMSVDETLSVLQTEVLTEIQCGMSCNKNVSCLYYFYEAKEKQCVMNFKKSLRRKDTRLKEGVVLYRKLVEISKTCLDAICQAEGCDPSDCNENDGCGFYHITKPIFIDCGQPGTDLKSCGGNKTCSESCIRTYMSLYGRMCIKRGTPTCEDYARIHKGGPLGCRTTNTTNYWQIVKKQLRKMRQNRQNNNK